MSVLFFDETIFVDLATDRPDHCCRTVHTERPDCPDATLIISPTRLVLKTKASTQCTMPTRRIARLAKAMSRSGPRCR